MYMVVKLRVIKIDGNTHVTTVIVHMGGVGEVPSVVSWSISTLDWCGTPDLLHSQSLRSVEETKHLQCKKVILTCECGK